MIRMKRKMLYDRYIIFYDSNYFFRHNIKGLHPWFTATVHPLDDQGVIHLEPSGEFSDRCSTIFQLPV